jgi:hypothetical protein
VERATVLAWNFVRDTRGVKKDERGRMWTEVDGSGRKLTLSGRRLLAGTSVWRATLGSKDGSKMG